MTAVTRRGATIATVTLALLGLVTALVATSFRAASAQTVLHEGTTEVFSNGQIPVTNGYFDFGLGSGEKGGTAGVLCTGSAELSPSKTPAPTANIAAQVITQLTPDSTRVLVLRPDGRPATGVVMVNCAVHTHLPEAASLTNFQQALGS